MRGTAEQGERSSGDALFGLTVMRTSDAADVEWLRLTIQRGTRALTLGMQYASKHATKTQPQPLWMASLMRVKVEGTVYHFKERILVL